MEEEVKVLRGLTRIGCDIAEKYSLESMIDMFGAVYYMGLLERFGEDESSLMKEVMKDLAISLCGKKPVEGDET